ncbi:hypothetical protein LINPERHAP2_LOCUS23496, partial [Linum perenne]
MSPRNEGKKGSSRRGLYSERSKSSTLFQIYNTDSGNVVSIRMNHPFHEGWPVGVTRLHGFCICSWNAIS